MKKMGYIQKISEKRDTESNNIPVAKIKQSRIRSV